MFTLIPVILAGGEGSRLWPLSSSDNPKQFLRLAKGGESLFASTYKRALNIAPSHNIVVVTRKKFARQAWQEIKNIDKKSKAQAILEPMGKNTAAAITIAAMHAISHFTNPVLWVMPSDHYIEKPFNLLSAVQESFYAANNGFIISFGIKPNRANENYGHILVDSGVPKYTGLHKVSLFIEKPTGRRLDWFMQNQNCLWNSGMFVFSANDILKHIKSRNNVLVDNITKAYKEAKQVQYGLLAESAAYNNVPNISIDKLVMENNENLLVKPVNIGWSDVGTWQSLWELSQKLDFKGGPLEKFLFKIQDVA